MANTEKTSHIKGMTKLSLYLTSEQLVGLMKLAIRTRRTKSSHIREAIDTHLKKHAK